MSAYILNDPTPSGSTLRFSAVQPGPGRLYLKLISLDDGSFEEIPFEKKDNIGTVCNMEVKSRDPRRIGYTFKWKDKEFVDPYALKVSGDETWGSFNPVGRPGHYEGPAPRRLSGKKRFSELVIYQLHVRGFTKHKSSDVKFRGTFEGLTEKIPYLKELGINAVELMPAYDFNEIIPVKEPESQDEAKKEAVLRVKKQKRLNYWGYTGGNYFVPKNSYSASGDGASSFVKTVSALHRAGIEVICDFYFEPDISSRFIVDVLRHWVQYYGVDGFALFGSFIPERDILMDPYLSDTRFIFEREPSPEALSEDSRDRVAVLNKDFMSDNRKFLKSDAGLLGSFSRHLMEEPVSFSLINYMASFNTLTLNDAVSYDRKHNEENGEGNTDGTDQNYSWNCGVEGVSRRKAVLTLRERQVKNAFSYILLSRGVPRIYMGDEFRNSQKGNNNPYCLDNTVTWLDWSGLSKNSAIFGFVKELIKLRSENPVFMHALTSGREKYPETSFHGEMAWQVSFHDYFRHMGVMYSGKKLYYCAFNTHWQEQKLALPKPEKKENWECILCTCTPDPRYLKEEGYLTVPPRSVIILRAW